MALVPLEYADKLADLELKDAALYDQVYQIQDALDRHELELARAENDFIPWAEVKADLGLE